MRALNSLLSDIKSNVTVVVKDIKKKQAAGDTSPALHYHYSIGGVLSPVCGSLI